MGHSHLPFPGFPVEGPFNNPDTKKDIEADGQKDQKKNSVEKLLKKCTVQTYSPFIL
jgi:hypothetical protein